MLLSKQLENSNVLYTRSLNVKVSADVGTARYCLWGGSYQEIVYCTVLNSKRTHQGLSSKRFKLLKVTPFQIKRKLLRVIVNSWACQVIFSHNFWITEKKKHFQYQRTIRVALFKGISMMFKSGIASAIVIS